MKWNRVVRVACRLVAALAAAELLYVLVANGVLWSGIIQREASKPAENVKLEWDRAYSPWPVRAYVSGLRLRLQDGVQQFRLTVEDAKVDVDLLALFHRRFRATYVRAEGVSYRQVVKVEGTAGQERRLAAFPLLEGFSRPALLSKVASPPQTPEEIAGLWSAELDRVDANFDELWFLEYRYHGPGRIHGGFAFSPVRSLWIGPALVQFDGGELTVGEHRLAPSFTAQLDLTLAPLDFPSSPGLRIFHTLTGTIRFDTPLEDLGAADIYLDGLRVRGPGRLTADLDIEQGKLTPRSSIEASLPAAQVQVAGYDFAGDARVKLWVSKEGEVPRARAGLKGLLRMPFGKESLELGLSEAAGEVVFTGNDLSTGLDVKHLHATLGEGRVQDARALTRKVGTVVPVVARMVLGDGPLVLSASAYVTPGYSLVRLEQAKLGGARISGAAVAGANGWNGAAAGYFGPIPLGLRLKDGELSGVPFTSAAWLGEELGKAGIEPEVTARK